MKKIYIIAFSVILLTIFLGIQSVGFFDAVSYHVPENSLSVNHTVLPQQSILAQKSHSAVVHQPEAEEKEEGEPEHKKELPEKNVIALFDPYTVLKNAVIADNINLIQSLINLGDSMDMIDVKTGQNLLHVAAMYNVVDIFNLLLDQGVNLKMKDFAGNTPLSYAIQYHNKDIVELINNYTDQSSSSVVHDVANHQILLKN